MGPGQWPRDSRTSCSQTCVPNETNGNSNSFFCTNYTANTDAVVARTATGGGGSTGQNANFGGTLAGSSSDPTPQQPQSPQGPSPEALQELAAAQGLATQMIQTFEGLKAQHQQAILAYQQGNNQIDLTTMGGGAIADRSADPKSNVNLDAQASPDLNATPPTGSNTLTGSTSGTDGAARNLASKDGASGKDGGFFDGLSKDGAPTLAQLAGGQPVAAATDPSSALNDLEAIPEGDAVGQLKKSGSLRDALKKRLAETAKTVKEAKEPRTAEKAARSYRKLAGLLAKAEPTGTEGVTDNGLSIFEVVHMKYAEKTPMLRPRVGKPLVTMNP